MRKMLFAAMLACGCAASTAKPESHTPTHSYAYAQETGKGWARGEFFAGRRHGRWEFFDGTGRKLRVGEYREGIMHGLWTFYFDNGDVVNVRYRNGVQMDAERIASNAR